MAPHPALRRRPAIASACVLAGLLAVLAGCAPPAPAPSPSRTHASPGTPSADVPPQERQWPGPGNTGVPEGTRLTAWEGECVITEADVVIDAREVHCDLQIRAPRVRITRSVIHGSVSLRDVGAGHSFSIADSEVHVGARMATGLGNGDFTAERVEVTGGRRSVYCSDSCTIEHSWVHAQAGDTDEGSAHLSGIRMGRNTTVRFNTIVCEGERIPPASGCSAALTGYGDFAPIQNNLIEGNLFQSGTASFCAFGGSTRDKPYSDDARDIRFIDNVFERDDTGSCGIHAPIEAFDPAAPGNVWKGNVWDDGEPVESRN